jgi:hypothetical protein
MKYIAKPNTWFDEGTEIELVDDYGKDKRCPMPGVGLFCGLKNGHLDEEVCTFDEFETTNE